jgi:predicted transposase/invertase (TIGR01784 family)
VSDHEQPDPADRPQQGVPHAHDGLFRLVFGKPAHAASELRAVLPPELTARLDLNRLTPVNGSFVDSTLRWRHSDVLLSTRMDGHDALVYVIIEHQSTPDPLMPWRMLRYLTRIWDRHLEDHPKATRLPLVIPIVVHQGHRPWTAPTELSQLIDLDPATAAAAAEYLPMFRYLLDDLARIDPAELQARPLTPAVRLTLLIMHAAPRRTDLTEDLESILDTIQEALHSPDGTEILRAVLTYIHAVTETPEDKLQQVMAQLGPEAEGVYMSTADKLRAQGEAKGRAEGEAKGRAEALAQLLTLKFGSLPDAARNKLRAASAQQLAAWTGRVLDASTVDDVFA